MNEIMKRILEEENELQFTSFDNQDALALGLIMVDIVKEKFNQGVAILIEKNREPLFTHIMKGATLDNIIWINRKKSVVDVYGHSSYYVGEMFKENGTTFAETSLYDPTKYQAEGGSFPLIIKGCGVVGTITVSGLPSADDHNVCVDAIREYLNK